MLFPLPSFANFYLGLNIRSPIAEIFNISERTFKKWESGKSRPNAKRWNQCLNKAKTRMQREFHGNPIDFDALIGEIEAEGKGSWSAFSHGFAQQTLPFPVKRTLERIQVLEKLTVRVQKCLKSGNITKACDCVEAENLDKRLIADVNFDCMRETRDPRIFMAHLLLLYIRVPLYLISSIEAEATAMIGGPSGLENLLPTRENGKLKLPVAKWFDRLKAESKASSWAEFEKKSGLDYRQLSRWRSGDLRKRPISLIPEWNTVEEIYKAILPDGDVGAGLRIFAYVRIFQRTYDLLVSRIENQIMIGSDDDVFSFFDDYAVWFKRHKDSNIIG